MPLLSIVLAVILTVLGLTADQTVIAHAAVRGWREVSRTARVLVAKGQHQRGIDAYQMAIKILKESEPENEAALDLQINLAQTFRLANHPEAASAVLNEVQSRFADDAVFLDPLLPRRYWRTKAAVALDVGDINEYLECAEHSQRIMNENFAPEWKRSAQDLSDLVVAECKYGRVESAVQRLDAAARNPIWELDKLGVRRDMFANISSFCHAPLVKLVAVDPDRAAVAIATLSKFEPRVQNLSYLWGLVFSKAANMRMAKPDDFILASVSSLLSRVQRYTSEESLHAQVDLHSIRGDTYRRRHMRKEELAELAEIAGILDRPHPDFSDGWREFYVLHQLKLAQIGAPDEAPKRLGLAKKVCDSAVMSSYWSERPDVHDSVALDIVRVYLDRNVIAYGDAALRKYSLAATKNRPEVLIRVVLVHLGRAACLYRANKFADARHEYELVKHFVERLPASRKDRAELVRTTEAYKQVAAPLKPQAKVSR